MKLISEYTESDLEYIVEADEKTGKKNYKIQGIFAQANVKNRNGRISVSYTHLTLPTSG